MKDSEIIDSVINLLSKPESWIKHVRAKTNDDVMIEPTDPRAVKFCLGGAVMCTLQDEEWEGWWPNTDDSIGRRFHQLAIDRGYESNWDYPFVEFNNDPDTTHEDMMMFLKEARCQAEEEEMGGIE